MRHYGHIILWLEAVGFDTVVRNSENPFLYCSLFRAMCTPTSAATLLAFVFNALPHFLDSHSPETCVGEVL